MLMRASEVENFDILHTKSAIFLPIFCRYKLYAYGMALYIVKIYVYASEQSERARKFRIFTY